MPITIDKIKEKRVQRRTLQEQGEQVLTDLYAARAARDATRAKELEESFERIHTDIEQLGADIDREERAYDAAQKIEEDERRGLQLEKVVAGNADADGDDETRDASDDEEQAELSRRATLAYIRGGFSGLNAEERAIYSQRLKALDPAEMGALRAMGVGSDTAGGFLVADEMMQGVVEAMKAFGGMRRARTNQFTTSTGADLPIATDNDTTNTGALLGEGQPAGEQDITVGQVVLRAYTYTSKIVKAHVNLLQDSAFDIESWLSRKLGIRIGRISNTHLTTGDGAAKPEGAVTGATLGKLGATGQTATVLWTDIQALMHSVDPDYRENAEFMFSDDSLLKVKQLLDGNGRPLWQSGVAIREPDTIEGKPYVVNQDMPAMAADAKSILFGDFANYYIRTVRGVTLVRFGERYMDALQVGFLAFARIDGALIDAGTNPIKYYQNSST